VNAVKVLAVLALLVLTVTATVAPAVRAQGQDQVPVGIMLRNQDSISYQDTQLYAVAVYGDYIYAAGRAMAWNPRTWSWYWTPYVVKFDRDFNVVWAVRIGTSDIRINSIAVGPDGSIYVTGDGFLTKLDQDGNLSWFRTLSITSTTSAGHDVAVAPDGSVYVAGVRYVAKFDSNGNLLWSKVILSNGCNYYKFVANGIAVAPDGSVYVAGQMPCGSSDNAFVAKLDSNGNLVWFRLINGSNYDSAYDVAVGPDGSVYVVGYTIISNASGADAFVAKFDREGNLKWLKTIGGPNVDSGYSIAVGPDGSVYIVVRSNSFSGSFSSYVSYVAKLDQDGNLLWFRSMVGDISPERKGSIIAVMPCGCPIYVSIYAIRRIDFTHNYGVVGWGYADEVDPSEVSVNDYTNNTEIVKSPDASTWNLTYFSASPGYLSAQSSRSSVEPLYGVRLLEPVCPVLSVSQPQSQPEPQPQPQPPPRTADPVQTAGSLGGNAEPFEYWLAVVPAVAVLVLAAYTTRRQK